VPHWARQVAGCPGHRPEQLAGLRGGQTTDPHRRELLERLRWRGLADGDHHADAVGVEPARHERQRTR
jgi:hypothetical protein